MFVWGVGRGLGPGAGKVRAHELTVTPAMKLGHSRKLKSFKLA